MFRRNAPQSIDHKDVDPVTGEPFLRRYWLPVCGQFGHDASKRTCLWLKGLAPLVLNPADYVQPRMVNGRPRWANQTDSGQNKLGPAADRWQVRSKTYTGIAQAMAEQWG